MTGTDFRSDRSRCSHLSRIMEMSVFKQAVAAVFEDLSLTEAQILNHNLDASSNLELRLQNCRKGHNDFLYALKMYCEPLADAPQEPLPDYGAGEEAAKLAGAETGWLPTVTNT